jgi:hypothetical protein
VGPHCVKSAHGVQVRTTAKNVVASTRTVPVTYAWFNSEREMATLPTMALSAMAMEMISKVKRMLRSRTSRISATNGAVAARNSSQDVRNVTTRRTTRWRFHLMKVCSVMLSEEASSVKLKMKSTSHSAATTYVATMRSSSKPRPSAPSSTPAFRSLSVPYIAMSAEKDPRSGRRRRRRAGRSRRRPSRATCAPRSWSTELS